MTLSADDVIVTERPRSGWAVESAAGETVALDLTVTPELRRAGLVREVVRLVQEARKAGGLDVTDRIELWWEATGTDLAEALRAHARRGRRRGPRRTPARRRARRREPPEPGRGPTADVLATPLVLSRFSRSRTDISVPPRPFPRHDVGWTLLVWNDVVCRSSGRAKRPDPARMRASDSDRDRFTNQCVRPWPRAA